jgi:hypothetical protein
MTDLPLERAIYDLSLEADVAAWGQDIAAIALSLLLILPSTILAQEIEVG